MRRFGVLAAVTALAGVVVYLAVLWSPLGRRLLPVAAGMAAKQICSLRFVSGMDVGRARALYLEAPLQGADAILEIDVDPVRESVTARVPGIVSQRAVHRRGFGCTLVQDESHALEPVEAPAIESSVMRLDAAHRAEVFDADRLAAAVDRAFRETAGAPARDTLAVVVFHDGKLIAERYADGVTRGTRLPGWSMTKSVTATLVGIAAEQRGLDPFAAGALPEWRDTDDPRSQISIDHLLRMTSGLAIGESQDGFDPNSEMLYLEPDAAHFAATRDLQAAVGLDFEYMSGSSVLAMRAVQEAIRGDLAEARQFVQDELFAPLGMQSAVLEPDQAGTFVGSSFLFATARDWARFGQLYVDGGMAAGRRLLPESWIEYVTTPTANASVEAAPENSFWESGRSGYGAGFWLQGDSAGLPPDTFDANGFQGQYVHIIPSAGLVIVRLGATNFRGHDHQRLPREVVAAMR